MGLFKFIKESKNVRIVICSKYGHASIKNHCFARKLFKYMNFISFKNKQDRFLPDLS